MMEESTLQCSTPPTYAEAVNLDHSPRYDADSARHNKFTIWRNSHMNQWYFINRAGTLQYQYTTSTLVRSARLTSDHEKSGTVKIQRSSWHSLRSYTISLPSAPQLTINLTLKLIFNLRSPLRIKDTVTGAEWNWEWVLVTNDQWTLYAKISSGGSKRRRVRLAKFYRLRQIQYLVGNLIISPKLHESIGDLSFDPNPIILSSLAYIAHANAPEYLI